MRKPWVHSGDRLWQGGHTLACWGAAQQRGRDLGKVIKSLVDHYLDAVARNNVVPVVCQVIPPSGEGGNEDSPYYGTLSDRAAIRKRLNGYLEEECARRGVLTINPYQRL